MVPTVLQVDRATLVPIGRRGDLLAFFSLVEAKWGVSLLVEGSHQVLPAPVGEWAQRWNSRAVTQLKESELTKLSNAVYTRVACMRAGQIGYRHEQDPYFLSQGRQP